MWKLPQVAGRGSSSRTAATAPRDAELRVSRLRQPPVESHIEGSSDIIATGATGPTTVRTPPLINANTNPA